MGLFSDKRSYDRNIGQVEKSETPYEKGFVESFMDDWHFQTYTSNSYSKTNNLHDEYEKEIATIKEQTGKELSNPYHGAFEDFIKEDVLLNTWDMLVKNPFSAEDRKPGYFQRQTDKRLQKRIKKYNKELNRLKEQFPELQTRTAEQINEDIKKQALEYYQKLNDGRDNNAWGSFAGSMAGSVIDPINFFGTLITGGGGAAKQGVMKALGKTAAREFVTNSTLEAIIQPSVYEYKKELDIPYSKTEAALNVAAAGVGGAVLGTAMKGVHLTSKQVLAKYKKAVAKGIDFDAKTKADAAFLEEKVALDDWLDETNPYGKDAEARLLHEESIMQEMKRLTDETGELSKAYDEVLNNPVGKANDPIVKIQPEDMERVWIERGELKPYNGDSKFGYGLVKFIFHHGEKSAEANKLAKADVVAFPKVIRDFDIVPDESTGKTRLWRVENEQGQRVVYIDKAFDEDGERHVVTMYIEDKAEKADRPLSQKKSDAGKPTAHTKEAEAPKSRFLDGGDALESHINPDELKVKDFNAYDAKAFEKELDAIPDLTAEEKKLNAEMVEKFNKEDGWDDHILDCIVEFSKK